MERSDIIEELCKRGFNAEAVSCTKNGVKFNGIVIRDNPNIAPVIYIDGIITSCGTVSKAADTVLEIYEASKTKNFDFTLINDTTWFSAHLYIAFQKSSNEALLKKDTEFEGIEQYLTVIEEQCGENYTFKVSKDFLLQHNLTEEKAWEKALENTIRDTRLFNLEEYVSGFLPSEIINESKSIYPPHIITNKYQTKGASAILNKAVLLEFAKKYNSDIILVIPSSINEMIIVPCLAEPDIESMSQIVKEVNESTVAKEDRLTDRAYSVKIKKTDK